MLHVFLAANGLRENEDGELLDEEQDKSQAPPNAKRPRHGEWAGARSTPSANLSIFLGCR